MFSPNLDSLHKIRAQVLDTVRRDARKRELRAGNSITTNPFYIEGYAAHGRGEPLARNESDPWRAGWLASSLAARYTAPASLGSSVSG